MAIKKILGKPGRPARRCPYCQKGLMPFKRKDAIYCSDSCRVMACVQRRKKRLESEIAVKFGGGADE